MHGRIPLHDVGDFEWIFGGKRGGVWLKMKARVKEWIHRY